MLRMLSLNLGWLSQLLYVCFAPKAWCVQVTAGVSGPRKDQPGTCSGDPADRTGIAAILKGGQREK